MKIFISWSGVRSHQVATFLQGMLREIFDGIEFYLSSDMERGARWSEDIFDSMAECNFGIIVFTPENKFEPWVMFEAGSLWKGRDAIVMPVYVDCDFHTGGPFREFQSVRLETHGKHDGDLELRRNIGGLTLIIETVAGRASSPTGSRRPMRLRYLTDQNWWKNQDALLRQSATVAGDTVRAVAGLSISDPAEETPILAYPHYRSTLTFDAMTRAVRETASSICLSSLGLYVYAKWEPFRLALNERVLGEPSISLKVALADPASESYVDQHRQNLCGNYRPEHLFITNAYGFKTGALHPLPDSYYDRPSLFGIAEIQRFIPDNQALHHFAALLLRLPETAADRVSLRLYHGWFQQTVLMFDHVVYMFPYGVNQDALEAPLFRFLPGQIGFNYFRGQFQSVFERSRPLTVNGSGSAGAVSPAGPRFP